VRQADFEDMFDSKFEVVGADQKVHPLIIKDRPVADETARLMAEVAQQNITPQTQVTWQNKGMFMRLVENHRLREFLPQCEAMRRGLATVVPYGIVSLFTPEELELEVCGRVTIDVAVLRANTDYGSSVSPEDNHIRLFWEMMSERFDDNERAKFLRFVWGRSRLPLPGVTWERKFKISNHSKSLQNPARVDDYLPDAHTCFFSLDLPRYTTMDAMYKKMLYAITTCISTDADHSLNRGGADAFASDDSEDEEDDN
jgi:hypothetical protein